MNLTVSNVALLTLGVGALSTAIELVKTANYIGAGIAAIIGLASILLYEKLPPSTPPAVPPTL